MTSSISRALESELGGPPSDSLAALADEDLEAFVDLLRRTKARQSRELEDAVEQALGVVPRLLRGPVRKVLFG